MSNDDWTPPPAIARLILAAFVVMLVATAIALALFVRIGG